MTTPISTKPRAIAGLLGALFTVAALLGLAGCNKRENPPAATTTTAPMPAPASDAMPAVPPASAASQ